MIDRLWRLAVQSSGEAPRVYSRSSDDIRGMDGVGEAVGDVGRLASARVAVRT